MLTQPATQRNVFRVLTAGFACVIALLAAASIVSLRNIQSIQENASSLIREQAVTNRLIDELKRQQSSVSEVFSVLARDPDSVDDRAILKQLDEADGNIDRIVREGEGTPERELWRALQTASSEFSAEARRLLNAPEPETFASRDLFRLHEVFVTVVSRLIERSYRKVNRAQEQIGSRSTRLVRESALFVGLGLLLALLFTGFTVHLTTRLIRRMEAQADELNRVSWHLLEDQETTARRFSHELHDELGGSLTAVKTNLTSMEPGQPIDAGRLADSVALVDEAIGNVRQLSQLLRPTILDDFGLEAGLRWLCEGFAARTGIEVHVRSEYAGRLPDETETHLFRIAQEALTNIARHAGAHHVEVRLEPKGSQIVLCISDDGRGLPAAAQPGARGLGLIGIRARARSAGGDLEVRSKPGAGVLIEVRVPMEHETHPHSLG